jgi:hypothetical protein
VWEDALEAGFVRVDRSNVRLTPAGRSALDAERRT